MMTWRSDILQSRSCEPVIHPRHIETPGAQGSTGEPPKTMNGSTLLFMPSCDGIGHAGRMLLVARALRERFAGKIEVAGNGTYGVLFPQAGFSFRKVGLEFAHERLRFFNTRWSFRQLLAFVSEGRSLLRRTVKEELALYSQLKPDLIVVDGRFTAPMSAWIAGIPYIVVLHPYMTPYMARTPYLPKTLPLFVRYPWLDCLTCLPDTLQTPLALCFWQALYRVLLQLYNRTLSEFGIIPARSSGEALQRAAAGILPDLEMTAPTVNLPEHFQYVGPLVWEPALEVPTPLYELYNLIYVTMGSSGNPRVFKRVVESLARMPEVQVVMSLARLVTAEELEPLPPNVHVYDYLPGTEIARRSRLVICHSGPTVYQALSQGVPIIGVPFNLPQEVIINQIVSLGAGIMVPWRESTPARIAHGVREVLGDPRYRSAARHIGSQFHLEDGPPRAAEVIRRALDTSQSGRKT